MRELKDGIRSLVKLDWKGRVHKWFRGTDADKRYANEVAVLKALEERSCSYVPRLLEEHPDELYFVSTNCGAPATRITKEKATALFHELEHDYGVRHDDPEPRNVTYNAKQGRFNLIDFELAEILPDPSTDTEQPGGQEHPSLVTRISWAAASRKGTLHAANDDFWLALSLDPDGSTNFPTEGEVILDPEHLILAVSDGIGGQAAGELASRLIMSWIRKHASQLHATAENDELFAKRLTALMEEAHEGLNNIAASQPESLRGMGATLTLAYLLPGKIHYAHIGDSRLYLADGDEVTQLTEDHCDAWQAFKKGKISELTYRQHPRRSALYDAMGGGHPRIRPQIGTAPLPSEARLLICSDGIVNGLWERHIAEALRTPASDIREIRDTTLNRAYQNSGTDDTTLILADIKDV
ncbi:MAG: protein phosphatase 2C domain-containing protein [Verrucomicrobiota bacterium JB023]|nr:protein phosphatase 2C domain-containing protein [Verrucomicrobiota bacterium JB023]